MKRNRTTVAFRFGPWMTLVFGAAALAYLSFVFLPAQKALRSLYHQSRDKQKLIAQAQGVQTQIVETRRELDQARKFVKQWRERSPEPTGMGTFLAQVTQNTQAAGVETVRLDPLQTESLETLSKVPFEIEVRGRFPQVFDLLRRLEQLPAPHWMEQVRIEAQSEDREELQCELKMAVFAGHTDISD